MMPIVAIVLSFMALTLQAQQTIPLPPKPAPMPMLVDQTAVPQESAANLQELAKAPSLSLKEIGAASDKGPGAIAKEADDQTEKLAVVLSKEDEEKRLAALPVFNLQTNKAPLTDVMTLLADACRMSYVGLEKGVGDNVQISVNINKNPYDTLQYLAKRYNVALGYDSGIWHFGIYNDDELIARIYHIRYNDRAEFSGGGGGSSGGSSTSSTSSTSSSSTSGSSSTGGTSSNVSSSATNDKTVKNDALVKDLETFLSFSSQNPSILTAADFDVKSITEIAARGVQRVLPKADSGSGSGASAKSGKVIYNGDTQTLYVLASRAQHQWIEKYLESVDKPQRQILVETKVYETAMSPEIALGVNLTGGNGNANMSMGHGTIKFSSSPGLPGGSNSAILSLSELTATTNLLNTDSTSISVQYPRQVTISNHPVAIASTEQVPIQQSTTSISSGTSTNGTTSTSSVNYVTTGTNISILPRIIDDNKVQMDISVTVSSISGFTPIKDSSGNTNNYPNVTQRDYKTQAIIESGYTLAIGGLKKTTTNDTYTGVPVISKVPFVGALFRNTDKKKTDTNLMIFISPTILDAYRGGVKENPEFILPRDKDYPERRIFQGTADESYTDIMLALSGFERQVMELAQRNKEGAAPGELKNSIDERENELKLMRVRLEEIALEQPQKDVSQASRQIEQNLKDLNELRRSIAKRNNILR